MDKYKNIHVEIEEVVSDTKGMIKAYNDAVEKIDIAAHGSRQ
jgi:hypothetical protein